MIQGFTFCKSDYDLPSVHCIMEGYFLVTLIAKEFKCVLYLYPADEKKVKGAKYTAEWVNVVVPHVHTWQFKT